jgi:hypothetical protein
MRDKLLQLLHKSECAVNDTTVRLERHRAILARMDTREPEAGSALALLRQFESNLGLFVAHRDQLLRMLEETALPTRRSSVAQN